MSDEARAEVRAFVADAVQEALVFQREKIRERVIQAIDDWWDMNGGVIPTPMYRKIRAAVDTAIGARQ